jgi:hypothetical protein
LSKGIFVVQSSPASAEVEDAFNAWYADTHIPQVCAIPGFVGVRRYRLHDAEGADPATPTYLSIYDLEADDISAPPAELRVRSAAGEVDKSDTLQTDPPPVVGLYELLD